MQACVVRVAVLDGDGGACQARAGGEETWQSYKDVVPSQGSQNTEDVYDDNTSQPNIGSPARVYASGRGEDRPAAPRPQSPRAWLNVQASRQLLRSNAQVLRFGHFICLCHQESEIGLPTSKYADTIDWILIDWGVQTDVLTVEIQPMRTPEQYAE